MDSSVPVMNESLNEMIYEMNRILNGGYEGFSAQLLKLRS